MTTSTADAAADRKLDHLLETLHRHRQRATYAAVADFVGASAQFVMAGRPRDARHCWVVNHVTLLPSGFGPEQLHPELRARPHVLVTSGQLEDWLRNPE